MTYKHEQNKKKPSQKERVIAYVKEHGSITPRQAYRVASTMRLAAIAYNLKGTPNELVNVRDNGKHALYVLKTTLNNNQ